MKNKKPKIKSITMNEMYGDGSNHLVCEKCGFCLTCKDCICKTKKNKFLKI